MTPENPYREAIIAPNNPNEELARLQLERELDPNEKILWAGRPRQGIYLTSADLLLVPFSLIWTGFTFNAAWSWFTSKHPDPVFALFGALFFGVGLYLVIGRFFHDAHTRKQTFYAVTNKHILIASKGMMSRDLAKLDIDNVPVILSERSDGSGSITFGTDKPSFYADTSWPMTSAQRQKASPPMFRRVDDARAAIARIDEAKKTLHLPAKNDE